MYVTNDYACHINDTHSDYCLPSIGVVPLVVAADEGVAGVMTIVLVGTVVTVVLVGLVLLLVVVVEVVAVVVEVVEVVVLSAQTDIIIKIRFN